MVHTQTAKRKRIMRNALLAHLSVTAVMIGLTSISNGGLILNVEIESVSSQISGREAINVVNGSGLATDGGGTFHISTSANGNYWMSGPQGAPWSIMFDLVANYDLASFHVWNFNRASGLALDRSANEVQISIADAVGGSFSILDSDPATGGVQNFFFPRTGEVKTYGQTFSLSAAGADNVRLVRFDILSNHDTTTPLDSYTGLSEVQFTGVVIVPEPSSLVLILLAGSCSLFFRRPRIRGFTVHSGVRVPPYPQPH
jgi:hypothetical protein